MPTFLTHDSLCDFIVDVDNPYKIPKGSLVYLNRSISVPIEEHEVFFKDNGLPKDASFAYRIDSIFYDGEEILTSLKGKLFSYVWGSIKGTPFKSTRC